MAVGDKKPVIMGDDVGKLVPHATHATQHAIGGSDPLDPSKLGAIPASDKGTAGGVATLDNAENVPFAQLGNVSRPNLLGNWYLADPIDQRGGYLVPPGTNVYNDAGFTSYVGVSTMYYKVVEIASSYVKVSNESNTYFYADKASVVRGYIGAGACTINNWKVYAKGTILCVDGGIRLVDVLDWGTQIENYKVPINIPITISVLTETGMGFATRSFSGQADESMYRDLGNGVAINFLRNWANSGTTLIAFQAGEAVVKAVKLELGSTQTLAHKEGDTWVLNDPPPDKNSELLKCIQSTADPADFGANKIILHTGNVTAGTADLVAGSSALATGHYYDVYE